MTCRRITIGLCVTTILASTSGGCPQQCNSHGVGVNSDEQTDNHVRVAEVFEKQVIVTESGDVWKLGPTAGRDCPDPLLQARDELCVGAFDERLLQATGIFRAPIALADRDCQMIGIWLGRASEVTVAAIHRRSGRTDHGQPTVEFSDGRKTWMIDPGTAGWKVGDHVLTAAEQVSPGEWYIHLRTGRVYVFLAGR